MKYVNLMNLTLSQIMTFQAAARFENFSVAAKYLNTTQPMVSRTIALLENQLGISLFTREKQRVMLTAAGSALASSWANLTEQIEESIRNAQDIHDHQENTITICDDRGADKARYLFPIMDWFSQLYPDVTLNIEQTDAAWAINSIYRGAVDLAFIMAHETSGLDHSLLDWRIVYDTVWGAYIHKSNPLFHRASLTIEDLKDEPLILLSTVASSSYSSTVISLFQQHGIQPKIHSYVSNNASLSFAMHQGNGVVMANEFLMAPDQDNTKFFPLKGTSDGIALIWRKNPGNALTLPFVDLAEKFFSKVYQSPS